MSEVHMVEMSEVHMFEREARDPYLLDAREAAALLRQAPWSRLAIVGDSGAEGVSEPVDGYRDLVWGQRVVEALQRVRPELAHVNLGRRDLLAAQVRQTQVVPALEFEPDLVIGFLGGNDLLGRVFDAAALEAELESVFRPFLERGATVLTSGLFDITTSPYVADKYRAVMSQRIAEYSSLVGALARRLGAVYLDLPAHPANTEEIYCSDGLHLNARGQAILATEVLRGLIGAMDGAADGAVDGAVDGAAGATVDGAAGATVEVTGE